MMSRAGMWLMLAACAGVMVSMAAGDSQERVQGAFVHVHKDFEVFEGQVGKEMVFSVEIHNMGEGDAYNVDFFDDAIQGENGKAFKLKEGSFKNHFDKIEAGDYVTFKQVIVPLVPGPLLIPSSVVTYTEEKSGGKKISVVGSVDGFNVLTTAQANTKTLLNVGRYASFGFCKTLADWLRLAAIVGGIAAITLTKSTFTKAKAMGESRRRKQAMKALGVEDLKDN